MSNAKVDISVLGKILTSDFDELTENQCKLAVIFSLMDGKRSQLDKLNDKVMKLFKNKKGHVALFKLRIVEAINNLIANRTLLRFGKYSNSLKLCDNYVEIFNDIKLKLNESNKDVPENRKPINLVDSFAKDKDDYLPQDVISNTDEILWFLKSILIHIRQRAGKSQCKDCSYYASLAELTFEHIDQVQLNTHVDYDDKRFEYLANRLKNLQHKAADDAMAKRYKVNF